MFCSVKFSEIKLTETVKKGGCAAKLPAGELRKILKNLALPTPEQLVVGTETLDDACLWDLGENYLIQTLDFFTPIVDDPKAFGAIAAANALSDVYAMGGAPKICLTILAFPSATLPLEILNPLMEGALEKISEAGACLAGGHSIDDETLKLGFSVSGFVPKSLAWKNSGAKAGDVLILTKALGTGTLTSAMKSKKAEPHWEASAIESMTQLNRAPELLEGITVNAATDITGFGLAGHAMQMAEASQKTLIFSSESLPRLPGAMVSLEKEILNRAHRTNWEYVKEKTVYRNLAEPLRWLTVDPQTSGGLLLSVGKKQAEEALNRLKNRFPSSQIIGEVREKSVLPIYVEFLSSNEWDFKFITN